MLELRALQIGIPLEDHYQLTIGELTDLIIEQNNDHADYPIDGDRMSGGLLGFLGGNR